LSQRKAGFVDVLTILLVLGNRIAAATIVLWLVQIGRFAPDAVSDFVQVVLNLARPVDFAVFGVEIRQLL
jgi:hypothetical protein